MGLWEQMRGFMFGESASQLPTVTPEARRLAERAAKRCGLKIDADEIVAEAASRIYGYSVRNPEAPARESAAAFFATVCRNCCNKLVQARVREENEQVPLTLGGEGSWDQVAAEGVPVAAMPFPMVLHERAAAALEHVATTPVALSGGLTWLVLAGDHHVDVSDAPRPERGVRHHDVHGWPALWFATRDRGLFGSSAAAARRRQRHIAAIGALRTMVADQLRGAERA